MPTVKALEFSQHLEQGASAPAYALVGGDDALVSGSIALLKEAVERPEMPGSIVTDLDAPPEPRDVFDELRTLPFMGMEGVRMVIVRAGDKFIAAYAESLVAYLAKPSAAGVLVLCCDKLSARSSVGKALARAGVTVQCSVTKWAEARRWAQAEVQKAGKTLTPQAASLLVEAVGPDIGMLRGELEKLILYADEEWAITEDDVEELVPASRSRSIFELSDAIAQGTPAKALRLGERLLLNGESPEGIVAFLGRQMRKLWQVKRMLSDDADQKAIERELKLRDFAARKAIAAVRGLTEEWFARRSAILAAADIELKTTSVKTREQAVWLDAMLMRLCQ